MVAAGWIVELLFGLVGLVPDQRNADVMEASVEWNYTTVLNIVFLVVAAVLVARFLRTGGPAMLRMMNMAPEEHAHEGHAHEGASHPSSDIPAGAPEDDLYVCPMHPEVRSSAPGRCPKCGMDLEPAARG